MHFSFLTPEYPNPIIGNSGGIGTSIHNLSHALINSGHQVTIFIYGQNRDESFFESRIHFHLIKNVKFKGLSWLLTRQKINRIIKNYIKNSFFSLIMHFPHRSYSKPIRNL